MPILVTGGAGYIGGQLVHRLIDRGERPVVLDDLSTGVRWAVPDGADFVQGSAGDAGLVKALVATARITAVCHLAGSADVGASLRDPSRTYRNNADASAALFEAAMQAGVRRVVFSSTAAIYGPSAARPLGEDDPAAPATPYAMSKLMAERHLADRAAAYGAGAVALRFFNVAGADPHLRCGPSMRHPTHLLKVAVQAALGLRAGVEVYGTDYDTPDGTCVRDYVHVDDIVEAHLAALDHLGAGGPGGIFNCGTGAGVSVREVIDEVQRQSGVAFPVGLAPRRAGDGALVVACTRRIRAILGWAPRWGAIEAIVGHALAWERRLAGRAAA